MEKILNCLQHTLTSDQLASLAGLEIVSLKEFNPVLFEKVANTPGTVEELEPLATEFTKEITMFENVVLPIGSPAFQMLVGKAVAQVVTTKFWFAHSERSSEDLPMPDGTVKKIQIFKHIGWLKL